MHYNLNPNNAAEAISRHASLVSSGLHSVDSESGVTAVIVSAATNREDVSPSEQDKLKSEGLAILDTLRDAGKPVVDVFHPKVSDMEGVFRNPEVSDICVIGEGSYGNVFVKTDDWGYPYGTAFDWEDVSRSADHVKTGNVYQRMCSVVAFSPVPWGAFAVRNLANIYVSEDPYFCPDTLHSRVEQGLVPLTAEEVELSYNSLMKIAMEFTARTGN